MSSGDLCDLEVGLLLGQSDNCWHTGGAVIWLFLSLLLLLFLSLALLVRAGKRLEAQGESKSMERNVAAELFLAFWHIFCHSFRHIFWQSDNYFWHSFWHIFWVFLAYLPTFVWHIFWQIFWHSFWYIFWHDFWHSAWQVFRRVFGISSDIIPSGILFRISFVNPSGISSEILRWRADGQTASWGPVLPTAMQSWWGESCEEEGREKDEKKDEKRMRRRRRRWTLIKSNNPHMKGVEKTLIIEIRVANQKYLYIYIGKILKTVNTWNSSVVLSTVMPCIMFLYLSQTFTLLHLAQPERASLTGCVLVEAELAGILKGTLRHSFRSRNNWSRLRSGLFCSLEIQKFIPVIKLFIFK